VETFQGRLSSYFSTETWSVFLFILGGEVRWDGDDADGLAAAAAVGSLVIVVIVRDRGPGDWTASGKDRQTDNDRDSGTDRKRERQREKEKETERQTDRKSLWQSARKGQLLEELTIPLRNDDVSLHNRTSLQIGCIPVTSEARCGQRLTEQTMDKKTTRTIWNIGSSATWKQRRRRKRSRRRKEKDGEAGVMTKQNKRKYERRKMK